MRGHATWLAAALAGAAAIIATGCGGGGDPVTVKVSPATVCVDAEGVALDGYDPVSYFEPGGPVAGDVRFSRTWNGATWRFATAAHRDAFAKSPASYAPRYGGVCSFAVSVGKHLAGVHGHWTVRDGKLYLNNNVVAKWLFRLLPNRVAKADANWATGKLKT